MNRSFAPAPDPSGLNHIPPLMESPNTAAAGLPALFAGKIDTPGFRARYPFEHHILATDSSSHRKTAVHGLWTRRKDVK